MDVATQCLIPADVQSMGCSTAEVLSKDKAVQCYLFPIKITKGAQTNPAEMTPAMPVPLFAWAQHGGASSCDDNRDRQHTCRSRQKKPQEEFHCSYCPYSTRHKSHVTRHERTHNAERPFVCTVCKKRFIDQHNLACHSATHTEADPHKCTDCGQCFSSLSALTNHKKQHSRKPRFTCSQCGRSLSKQQYLDRHMLSHTQAGRLHMCRVCGKVFVLRDGARNHEMLEHGEQ